MSFRLFGSGTSRRRPRVAIIGLDGAEPSLVFDRWADNLLNLASLRRRGLWGELESVIPAATVPAWSCMMAGKDPGTLGIYGSRDRDDRPYDGFRVPDSEAVREPRLWDVVSRHGKEVIVLGVPQMGPPSPVRGGTVASPPKPGLPDGHAYPPEPVRGVEGWVGEDVPDASSLRALDKATLLEQVCVTTRKRFEAARQLLRTRPWDLFVMVEMGMGRIHHGFWTEMDPLHGGHDPVSPFKDAIAEYYRYVDREIGTLLELFGDDTHVLVVSGHGCRRMVGGICLNEWLIREGYLALAEEQDLRRGPVRLGDLRVDWSRTRVWGEGGYYGRIFVNLRGREPHGIVEPAEYEALRDELVARLEAVGDENGRPIGTRCFKPQDVYHTVQEAAPDLIVYFGDLAWRAVDTVGWNRLHVLEDDAGLGDANPAQHGIFLYSDPARDLGGRELEGLHLLQIAPTVLRLLELPVPTDMQRPPIAQVADRPTRRASLVSAIMGRMS